MGVHIKIRIEDGKKDGIMSPDATSPYMLTMMGSHRLRRIGISTSFVQS